MAQHGERIAKGLIFTAAARREQAPLRLFVALVFAVAFGAELTHWLLWAWLAGYVASQAFEVWALWPFRSGAPAPPAWRSWTAVGSIFLLAATFGAIALPLWMMPGSLAPATAVLILAGGMLNVLHLSRGSPLAFMAGASPYYAYLIAAPLLDQMINGEDAFGVPFIMAGITFLVAVVLVYVNSERLAAAQGRATAELEARRAGAEASAEAKGAFVAVVSHELRTPLSGILAAAGDLHRRASDPELRSRAAMVSQGARMMRAILDDLLDLSKLEAGRMRVETVPFDPRQMMEEAAQFWSAEADRKGLSLALEGAARLPTHAVGDPLRLRQILNNLLSNAVKFTDAGSVRIECDCREAGGQFLFSAAVVDTGPGLSPDRLASLFQPFEQGDASVARTHGGTGLGLAISRQLARLMGGDLAADGAPGRGCRFTFSAALAKGDGVAPVAAPAPAATPAPSEQAPRILVVDDHPFGRQTLGILLEPLGAVVTPASSGPEALERLAAEPFDLVLMDVTMTGMDGVETCRRLRRTQGPNQHAPVLAVTGRTEQRDVDACTAAGMNGWIAKPVDARQLYEAIEGVLCHDEVDAA